MEKKERRRNDDEIRRSWNIKKEGAGEKVESGNEKRETLMRKRKKRRRRERGGRGGRGGKGVRGRRGGRGRWKN